MREDVALEIDAGGDFDQFQSALDQPERTAFGDIENGLPALECVLAVEGQLFHYADEFLQCTFPGDR